MNPQKTTKTDEIVGRKFDALMTEYGRLVWEKERLDATIISLRGRLVELNNSAEDCRAVEQATVEAVASAVASNGAKIVDVASEAPQFIRPRAEATPAKRRGRKPGSKNAPAPQQLAIAEGAAN